MKRALRACSSRPVERPGQPPGVPDPGVTGGQAPGLPTQGAALTLAWRCRLPFPRGGCLAGAASARRWIELVASVRAGHSRALVLRGDAGVGKSALLEYLAQHSSGCAIARAAGVESEMELAYAGLQQLCAPFLDRLERLPGPQRDALGTAFGLRDGDAPDRFLVGLAVLSLLSDVAEERPPRLHRRRRAVARRGLGAGAGVRRAPSRCGVGRAGLRRARAERRAALRGAAGARRRRAG